MQCPSLFLWTYKPIPQSHSISIFIHCWSTHCKKVHTYHLCTLNLHQDALMQEVFKGRTETARGATASAPNFINSGWNYYRRDCTISCGVEKCHLMERMRNRKCGEVLNVFLVFVPHPGEYFKIWQL